MYENPTGKQQVLRVTIDLPGVYTADLPDLIDTAIEDLPEDATDSDLLFEALQLIPQVGVRMMVVGETDHEMVQMKGVIVKAELVDGEAKSDG